MCGQGRPFRTKGESSTNHSSHVSPNTLQKGWWEMLARNRVAKGASQPDLQRKKIHRRPNGSGENHFIMNQETHQKRFASSPLSCVHTHAPVATCTKARQGSTARQSLRVAHISQPIRGWNGQLSYNSWASGRHPLSS